jgi:hypothetical protein
MLLEYVRCLITEESSTEHAVMFHKGRKNKNDAFLRNNGSLMSTHKSNNMT